MYRIVHSPIGRMMIAIRENDECGHVQSVDQALAAEEALDSDPPLLAAADIVLFLAAGTGYAWAATVLDWVE